MLAEGLRDGDAERGEAVKDGDAALEFGGLTFEVSGHELLAEQLHAVHLGLGAASAVVAAPPTQMVRPRLQDWAFRRGGMMALPHGEETSVWACKGYLRRPPLACAPAGGHDHAAILPEARALRSSSWAGL